jgi:hypothetical protein
VASLVSRAWARPLNSSAYRVKTTATTAANTPS